MKKSVLVFAFFLSFCWLGAGCGSDPPGRFRFGRFLVWTVLLFVGIFAFLRLLLRKFFFLRPDFRPRLLSFFGFRFIFSVFLGFLGARARSPNMRKSF